jgi:hypothetical protein
MELQRGPPRSSRDATRVPASGRTNSPSLPFGYRTEHIRPIAGGPQGPFSTRHVRSGLHRASCSRLRKKHLAWIGEIGTSRPAIVRISMFDPARQPHHCGLGSGLGSNFAEAVTSQATGVPAAELRVYPRRLRPMSGVGNSVRQCSSAAVFPDLMTSDRRLSTRTVVTCSKASRLGQDDAVAAVRAQRRRAEASRSCTSRCLKPPRSCAASAESHDWSLDGVTLREIMPSERRSILAKPRRCFTSPRSSSPRRRSRCSPTSRASVRPAW